MEEMDRRTAYKSLRLRDCVGDAIRSGKVEGEVRTMELLSGATRRAMTPPAVVLMRGSKGKRLAW